MRSKRSIGNISGFPYIIVFEVRAQNSPTEFPHVRHNKTVQTSNQQTITRTSHESNSPGPKLRPRDEMRRFGIIDHPNILMSEHKEKQGGEGSLI